MPPIEGGAETPSSSWSSPATPTRAKQPTTSSGSATACTRSRRSGLLGGIPAENYDIEQTNARDTRLIVPLVLLVVGLILVAVLRALVAPALPDRDRRPLLRRHPRPLHLRLLRARRAKASPSTSSCSPSSSSSRSGSTTTSS